MSAEQPTSSLPKRVDQLRTVYDKALNESINSIGGAELRECCTDAQVANNIQNVFVNMIYKAETKMQESYDSISQLQKLEDIIRNSMNLDTSGDSSLVDGPLNELVISEKQKEKERLTAAIQQLDGDVRRTKDSLSRLKAQVQNEIAAATEECQKMSVAAAQIGRNQVQ
eukprot:gene16168-18455_t